MSDLKMISNINNLLINNHEMIVNEIIELNKTTERYGLTLTKEQAIDLVNHRNTVLKEVGRIELGGGILEKLIYEFCDSPYLYKDEYLDILEELTNIFYEYRCEFDGKLTDEQIIKYMKIKFDTTCNGSLELLSYKELEYLKEHIKELMNEI
ncbi:MAG: DUF6323 family protein [Candidatus Coprovivens sp.]